MIPRPNGRGRNGPKPIAGVRRTVPLCFRTTEETAAWFRELSAQLGCQGAALESLHLLDRQRTAPLFAVMPGRVRSRSDGQWHHVTADMLMSLYRVPPELCREFDPHETVPDDLYRLRPRQDGNYRLTVAMQKVLDARLRP